MRGLLLRLITAGVVLTLLIPAPAAPADLLVVASRYVGQTERGNRGTLKALLGVDPRLVKWCGAFVAAMARKAGYRPPGAHNIAASWSRFGRSVGVKNARRGDVVVLRGHVTIFTKFKGGKICGIGGNQSNAVRESCYPMRRVVTVRRPRRRQNRKMKK